MFRNGSLLAWRHHFRSDVNRAVFWNGRSFRMPPGRTGLAETIVEMWGGRAYTSGGFYQPAPGHTILDIGANVGAFSLWVAQQCPEARVVAVEPSPDNFEMLQQNLAGWKHRVAVVCVAVGASRGRGLVVDGGRRTVDHRVRVVSADDARAESVKVVPLVDLLQQAGTELVDFLKMDIEGAEFDVFSTMSDDTQRRFRKIALEYHDNLRPGTLAMLTERLERTHEITSIEASAGGYGILRAVLR